MKYPRSIQNLINQLSLLPSVGPKTAERYAFHLLKKNEGDLKTLAEAIQELKSKTLLCQRCLAVSDDNPCPICADQSRLSEVLCLVADQRDLAALEATGQYRGLYFVLGGLISTIEEVSPEDLNIAHLLKRVQQEKIQELILALNFTLEGETTALYLSRLFKGRLKISRLARGLPAGSDLEYADELTLRSALENRSEMIKA